MSRRSSGTLLMLKNTGKESVWIKRRLCIHVICVKKGHLVSGHIMK